MRRLGLILAFGLAALAWTPSAQAVEWVIDVQLGGGTVMAWDHPDEAGNTYGGTIGVTLDTHWRVGLAAAGVLPDSRIQAHFGAYWVEFQYHPFKPFHGLSPYVIHGLGLTSPDEVETTPGQSTPVRWSKRAEFLAVNGIGLAYGGATGLYVALDVRALNIAHGGVNLSVGWRF